MADSLFGTALYCFDFVFCIFRAFISCTDFDSGFTDYAGNTFVSAAVIVPCCHIYSCGDKKLGTPFVIFVRRLLGKIKLLTHVSKKRKKKKEKVMSRQGDWRLIEGSINN